MDSLISPCSGNLIAPTVFVTAAHCLEFIESQGATQVWVSFASHVVADVNFIEVSNLDTSTLIPGTLHPNPAFDAHAPDANDVAVITFETPVDGITPAVLPTLGLLDELGQQNGLKDQLFTVVGYGVNQRIVGGGPKTYLRDLSRRFATSGLNSLTPALLRLSTNRTKGFGEPHAADSGGGIFLGQSNTLVAIVGLRGTPGITRATVLIPRRRGRSSPTSPRLLFRAKVGPTETVHRRRRRERDETGERCPRTAHRPLSSCQSPRA